MYFDFCTFTVCIDTCIHGQSKVEELPACDPT